MDNLICKNKNLNYIFILIMDIKNKILSLTDHLFLKNITLQINEECFIRCVKDLDSKSLNLNEKFCYENCAKKFKTLHEMFMKDSSSYE